MDHAGIVSLGLLHFHQLPALAAKPAADAALAGVVLSFAVRALDEQRHRTNPQEFKGQTLIGQWVIAREAENLQHFSGAGHY
jgi:hypothetical protein